MRVLIDGLGLMGGSLAAALQDVGATVFCHHRRRKVAAEAQSRGWGQAVTHPREAEVVDVAITCVPVSHIEERIRALHQALPSALLSDVGSSKGALCAALSDLGKQGLFIGSHPMCGSHAQGLAAAQSTLYQGATVVMTPDPDCPATAQDLLRKLWSWCGARVRIMPAAAHDQAVAEASHLPHILAAQAARLLGPAGLPLAATGFRDTTRVAASSPSLWSDILLHNRQAVLAQLQRSHDDLRILEAALEQADHQSIEAWLSRAAEARQAFDQRPE